MFPVNNQLKEFIIQDNVFFIAFPIMVMVMFLLGVMLSLMILDWVGFLDYYL
jgi:hypothetical protein